MVDFDYYCFMSAGGKKEGASIFERSGCAPCYSRNNFRKDQYFNDEIKYAQKLGRIIYCHVKTNKIYADEECTKEIKTLNGIKILPRSMIINGEIPMLKAIKDLGGESIETEEDEKKISHWPLYIQPLHRKVLLTTIEKSKQEILDKLPKNLAALYAIDENIVSMKNKADMLKNVHKDIPEFLYPEKESDSIGNIFKLMHEGKLPSVAAKKETLPDKLEAETDIFSEISKTEFEEKLKAIIDKIPLNLWYIVKKISDKFRRDKNYDYIYNFIKQECKERKRSEVLAKIDEIDNEREKLESSGLFIKSMQKGFHGPVFGLKEMSAEEMAEFKKDVDTSKSVLHGMDFEYTTDANCGKWNAYVIDKLKPACVYKFIRGFRENKEKAFRTMMENAVTFEFGSSLVEEKMKKTKNEFKEWERKYKNKNLAGEVRKDLEKFSKLKQKKFNPDMTESIFVLDENEEIMISPVVKICEDEKIFDKDYGGRAEYRNLVLGGKLYCSSPYSDEKEDIKNTPDRVKAYVRGFIKRAKQTSLPTSYIIDVAVMEVDGKEVVDMVEMNPVTASGRFVGSKIIKPKDINKPKPQLILV